MPRMNYLKKGSISICDDKGTVKDKVEFTFNPASYRIAFRPNYKDVTELAQDAKNMEFTGGVSSSLSVTLFFDSFSDKDLFGPEKAYDVRNIMMEGTENKIPPITDKLKRLEKATHVEGATHKPPLVIFAWGNLKFRGVITDYSTEYTMFSMEGKPIRATVQLTIMEVLDPALNAKQSPFESPDRTKSRVVVEGMSLWSIAYQEYDDCEKWREIARANNIMNPLDIKPGQVIRVPALEIS